MLSSIKPGSLIKWFIGGNGTVDVHPGVVVGFNPQGHDDRGVAGEIITAVMLKHTQDGEAYLRIQNLRNGAFVWDRDPSLNDPDTGDVRYEALDGFSPAQLLAKVQKSTLDFVRERAGTAAVIDPATL